MLSYGCCSELFGHEPRTERARYGFSLGPKTKNMLAPGNVKMITVHEKMYP